ncbi:MAG: hypothetical protein AAFV46_09950, partial [Cyanobacteria bacterium J06635_11]
MTPEGADQSQDMAANGLSGAPNAAPNAAEWLTEVQSLQRQVGELQQARDRAYASADNLRQLYDAEAQQHRRDVEAANQKIERLKKALAVFQPPNVEYGQCLDLARLRQPQRNPLHHWGVEIPLMLSSTVQFSGWLPQHLDGAAGLP